MDINSLQESDANTNIHDDTPLLDRKLIKS